MEIEQKVNDFLANDFKYQTIGEIVKELIENRAAVQGLNTQLEHLQDLLTASVDQAKTLKNEKRQLEQELKQK